MTAEELEKAVQKLIEEANAESAAAKSEYEKDCLEAQYDALKRRTFRSSILENLLAARKEEYDAQVRQRIWDVVYSMGADQTVVREWRITDEL